MKFDINQTQAMSEIIKFKISSLKNEKRKAA